MTCSPLTKDHLLVFVGYIMLSRSPWVTCIMSLDLSLKYKGFVILRMPRWEQEGPQARGVR